MAGKLLILFMLLVWSVPSVSIDFSIPYVTPKDCRMDQYFQFSSLRCIKCITPDQKGAEDQLSCVCETGYMTTLDKGGPTVTCKKCNSEGSLNSTSSLDGSFCITCPNVGSCQSCPANFFASDRSQDGSRLSTRRCISCVEDTTATGVIDKPTCQRCHSSFFLFNNSTCSGCNNGDGHRVSGGICFEDTKLQPLAGVNDKVKYSDKEILSSFFQQHLKAAQILCSDTNSNFTACQLLGNLCVMLEYTRSGNDACKQFTDLVGSKSKFVNGNQDWPVVMPWLFYEKSAGDAVEVLDKKDITKQFQLSDQISFIFAVFTLNGSFIGFKEGLDVLQLCKDRPSKMAAAQKFATTYKSTCSVAVKDLISKPMLFYDMYLVLDNKLYPVPLLLENFKLGNEEVNKGTDRTKWKLTRRFFIVDNLIGRSDNQALKWIRYCEKIELSIRMRSTDGEIYPPMLRIRYKALDVQDAAIKNGNQDTSFAVTYEMDTKKIEKDTEVAIGCLSALAFILALVKVSTWRRREGKLEIDGFSFIKLILFCFGTFSTMLFWVAFGMAVYWLIFFKQQKTVSLLLPSESQEKLFLTLLYVTFTFKLLDVIHMLASQVFFDIFFVDWERPQGRVNQPTHGGEAGAKDAPVSIWRTLFIANEWNEIQTMRKINPELQIFTVLFFLKVAGFEYLATTDPAGNLSVNYTTEYVGEFSKVLRFAILSVLFLIIEAVQWFFFAFIYERFVGDALGDFIDLCSMSNVSIFILENNRYGYYIHGRSVHGRADTDMWQMNDQLKREEEDLCGKRGLEPNTERQTFEIEVPFKFREQYEDVVRPLRQGDTQLQRRNLSNNPTGQDGRPSRLTPAVEKRIQAYNTLNRFLSAFIDHSLRDIDYLVRDKLLFEHILNMELKELPPPDKAIFYNDDGRSFNSILFYGNEWTLMLFDLLMFAFVDSIAQDFVLAGIITYLIAKVLKMTRDTFGRKNLTRKTLVDERFLI